MTSAPFANFSTWSDVDEARGGASTSLPASPPITTLPAGVSTRYDAWPAVWVDRIALTFTPLDDQTTCGSSFGSKVIRLIKSAGPPATRALSSERRSAISPDWRNASPICVAYFRQLLVNPTADTASELQTTSIFGPFRYQRSSMIS